MSHCHGLFIRLLSIHSRFCPSFTTFLHQIHGKTLGNIGKAQNRCFFRSSLEISWGWQWTFSIKTFKWNTFRLETTKQTPFFTMSGKDSRSNMATLLRPQEQELGNTNSDTFPLYNSLHNASELEVDVNIEGVSNIFNLDINPSMIGCQLFWVVRVRMWWIVQVFWGSTNHPEVLSLHKPKGLLYHVYTCFLSSVSHHFNLPKNSCSKKTHDFNSIVMCLAFLSNKNLKIIQWSSIQLSHGKK